MRSLITFLLCISSGYAFAQTNADIQMLIVEPVPNHNYAIGEEVKLRVRIANHGPVAVTPQNDTMFVHVAGDPIPSPYWTNIAVGDTSNPIIIFSYTNDGSTPGQQEICAFLKHQDSNFNDGNHNNDTACVTFNLLGSTSIEKIDKKKVIVSLKRSGNSLDMAAANLSLGSYKLEVLTMNGTLVLNTAFEVDNSESFQKRLSFVPASNGLYIYRLSTNKFLYSGKFLY